MLQCSGEWENVQNLLPPPTIMWEIIIHVSTADFNVFEFLQMVILFRGKALSCREEAICEHDPESLPCSLGQSLFRTDWGKMEKCFGVKRIIILNFFWNNLLCVKEEREPPACYHRSVLKSASLMPLGCISVYWTGSLHIWKGTINTVRYKQV